MKPEPIAEQLDRIEQSEDNRHLFYTPEFQNFLKKLRSGKNLGREDLKTLFEDESKVELNLGLLSKYAEIALSHSSDEARIYLVDILHDLYFSRKFENSAEEMKVMIVKAVKSIGSSGVRKIALTKVREILDEDSCCLELRAAVEEVIRIDDPNFRWD